MSLLKGETNLIGLDIGTTGVRLVQLKGGGQKPRLATYGSLKLDVKVTQSDAPTDRQQLVEAIKRLVNESKVSSKQVVAGLPSSKVYSSLVNLPKMSKEELEKSISYQAEQYMPVALDQIKYDWITTEESDQNNQMEILLIGVQRSIAEDYLNMLESAGLEAIALEPDTFGLGRAFSTSSSGAVVILNIGAHSTDLVTVYKGHPRLIRSIPTGGETLVKTVAQNLNLSSEQASQFLYKFGLAEGKLEGQVIKAIKGNIDSLISEVDKSNKFFVSRYKSVKIDKIVITGGSSQLPQLPNVLANSTGLPVEIGNAWANVEYDSKAEQQLLQLSSNFAVAVGLAMRGGAE